MPKFTWVGIAPCGHANFLAADIEERAGKIRKMEDLLGVYRDLVEDLKYYAQHGSIKFVDADALPKYTAQFQECIQAKCVKKPEQDDRLVKSLGLAAEVLRETMRRGFSLEDNEHELIDLAIEWLESRSSS